MNAGIEALKKIVLTTAIHTKSLVLSAQNRSAKELARRDAEFKALAECFSKVDKLAAGVNDTYQPHISQMHVNSVSWQTPMAVEDILGAECDRIRAIVYPLLNDAGFPLESKDTFIKKRMNEKFYELMRPLHQKAFSTLNLPPFFAMQNGLIEFEPTSKSSIKSTFLYPYVGMVSGYRYIDNRYMPDPPSMGFY